MESHGIPLWNVMELTVHGPTRHSRANDVTCDQKLHGIPWNAMESTLLCFHGKIVHGTMLHVPSIETGYLPLRVLLAVKYGASFDVELLNDFFNFDPSHIATLLDLFSLRPWNANPWNANP